MGSKSKRTPRIRHLRHRKVDRFRTNPEGTYRSDATMDFLEDEAAAFSSVSDDAFTIGSIDLGTDTVTMSASHGLSSPAGPYRMVGADVPAGTDTTTDYYLKPASASSVTLHPTLADAVAGTAKVDITDAGTATKMFPYYTVESLFNKIKSANVRSEKVAAVASFTAL